VAKLLKTNADYVHKLRRSGKLPFLKIGQYKCRKEALEKFLAENEGKDLTDPENVKEL
jgi:excisionase family DNA binding protein